MNITQYILDQTTRLQIQPEVTPGGENYSMFNTGGVEIEVAELLYALVKLIKPRTIVETGTHLGVSSLYMALALRDNREGRIITYEIISELQNQAILLWQDLEVENYIDARLEPSLTGFIPVALGEKIDLLFLDSEPQYRFDEFLRFWEKLAPGGLIVIHDLHSSLGHHGQTYHGTYDWPYGYWKDKLESYIKEYKVQTLHFPCPRGLTIFQKTDPTWEIIQCLTG